MNFYTPSISKIPSVSEFTQSLKQLLESNFAMISVQGEVSQPVVSANGHLYFTLKDDQAQLSCVMWRTTRQRTQTQLVQGQQITAFGSIKVYAPSGKYQLLVENVQQAGTGALQAAYERLKKKLEVEGLFDASRKKALPRFPQTIGVITSETSAAWHDIAVNLEKRWPAAEVKLYHASTQGATAAAELVRGIHYFSLKRPADVIIIGRGGGSLEDLWPFNEEALARAIAQCPTPVISGVGHETDFTICDFVSDVRANTPTQAAILATPDKDELSLKLDENLRYLKQLVTQKWQIRSQWVQRLTGSYALHKLLNKAGLLSQQIQHKSIELKRAIDLRVQKKEQLLKNANEQAMRLQLLSRVEHSRSTMEKQRILLDKKMGQLVLQPSEKLLRLESLLNERNPLLPMDRGFSRVIQHGKMIKNPDALTLGEDFEIQWKSGSKHIPAIQP
jgi:exodeoxyribonuclease VII large subunit